MDYGEFSHWFDLENPEDVARISDPLLALRGLKGLVVLDEIQRAPELFPALRVLADDPERQCCFLLLGSASPHLIRNASESLAGRIEYFRLNGFHLDELSSGSLEMRWIRGGFPRSFIAGSGKSSFAWRRAFVRTFLERDLPQLGINISSTTLRRFWTMLAHYHGQIWNSSEFARSFGVVDTTVRSYLDKLTDALVVFQLPPWHENISKRQVKSPKVYLADSGLVHTLLNLPTREDVESHPKCGASWEGFAIEQILWKLQADESECYFWATHSGADLDLLFVRGRIRLGFEIKRTLAPAVTKSMKISIDDLKLDHLYVIHAGQHRFPLAERILAVPLELVYQESFLN
jgi:predicted AAA+ superfamily ATPase